MTDSAPDQETMGNVSTGRDGAPKVDFLKLANGFYDSSTDYVTGYLRRTWDKTLKNFQSQHPNGSKYHSDDYKNRSKIFRPKTKSIVRRGETAAAKAFFSTSDVIGVKANDDDDPTEQASAAVNKELMQYRLTNTVPWFLTCVGAYQDTEVYGICASRQWWWYEERKVKETFEPHIDENGEPVTDEHGVPIGDMVSEFQVIHDTPRIDLLPPENLRVDINADWTNPIQSSPALIVKWPMTLIAVREKMKSDDPKTGQPEWALLEDAEIRKAKLDIETDATKTTRDQKLGSTLASEGVTDFDLIDIREVFMRHDGEDWVYWTLGSVKLLTEPVPLDEAYPHMGERPYVMGSSSIEAHKTYPAGKAEMIAPLQQEVNDVTNLRLDNSKLAMTGRFFVKRGRNVDLPGLMRSTPGGIVLTNDPATDIKVERSPEVPASSYQEVDRLNADLDDLAGNFSTSSVDTNRSMGETVGGMNLISGDSSSVTEYELRVFVETWVEPVLKQMMKLIQAYETDATVLALAGKKANLAVKFGINHIDDDLLMRDLIVTVNVGIGATNPTQQLQQLEATIGMIAKLVGPAATQLLNLPEIITEVFGKIGYKDGKRFFNFPGDDPRIGQLMMIIQQMQMALQTKSGEIQAQGQVDTEIAQIAAQAKQQVAQIMADSAAAVQEIKNSGQAQQSVIDTEGAAIVEEIIHRNDMHGTAIAHQHDIGSLLLNHRLGNLTPPQPTAQAPVAQPPAIPGPRPAMNMPPSHVINSALARHVALLNG